MKNNKVLIRGWFAVLMVVMFCSAAAAGTKASSAHVKAEGETQSQPHIVRKIFVGGMGETSEAERFRLLLEEELSTRSFTVVDKPDKADAILTGVLSVRVYDKKTKARVYVKLGTPQGEWLWREDFGSRVTSPFNRTEPVKLRAQDVAKGLRAEWERLTKSASTKTAQWRFARK